MWYLIYDSLKLEKKKSIKNKDEFYRSNKSHNIQFNNFKALSKLEFWMFIYGFSFSIKVASVMDSLFLSCSRFKIVTLSSKIFLVSLSP